jgi:uncharacterized protein YaaR (DUF327 family)
MKKNSLLEKLQDKIASRTGKELSQEETIGKIIEFSYSRFNEFIKECVKSPPITDKLIKRLKKTAIVAPIAHLDKSDDELLYGFK